MRTCFRRPPAPRRYPRPGLAAAAVAALLSACAQVEAPPGGPVDDRPAALVTVEPDSLAVKVSPAAPLRLTFSEKVTRTNFGRMVEVVPSRTFRHVGFDGVTVELRPDRPWPADTVVVWTLLPTLKDRHGVALGRPISGAFTTGDSIPAGVIAGSTAGKDLKPGRVRVALTQPPAEGQKRGLRWRLVDVQADGSFRIAPLDVPSGPFQLEAFEDRDGNGRRDPRELVARLDSLSVTPQNRILSVGLLELIDLEGPVEVWACLGCAPGDTLRRRLGWRPVDAESSRATSALLDSAGCAAVMKLTPGRYELALWVDRNADGRLGPDSTGVSEPFAEPITLEVLPARPDTVELRPPDRTLPWTVLDTLSILPVPRDLLLAPER